MLNIRLWDKSRIRKEKQELKSKAVLAIILTLLFIGMLSFTFGIQQVEAVAEVEILPNHSNFIDSIGWYHIVGEVQNTGDVAAKFIKITATFYDAGDTPIDVEFSYTEIDVVNPGRKSPFEVILLDAQQSIKVDHYSLSVSHDSATSKTIGLEILAHSSHTDILGWMHIVGEINNTGTSDSTLTKVVACYYDETGTVVDTEFTYTDDIPPGEFVSFEIILISAERTALVDSYALEAESTQFVVIAEFPSFLIVPLFMIATLLAVIIYRRKCPERAQPPLFSNAFP